MPAPFAVFPVAPGDRHAAEREQGTRPAASQAAICGLRFAAAVAATAAACSPSTSVADALACRLGRSFYNTSTTSSWNPTGSERRASRRAREQQLERRAVTSERQAGMAQQGGMPADPAAAIEMAKQEMDYRVALFNA